MIKILGIGNALVDILVRLDNDDLLQKFALAKGSMQLVDQDVAGQVLKATEGLEQSKAAGGSAANTIHALAKMGTQVSYVGKVADDELGTFFSHDMEKAGVVSKMKTSKTPTGKAVTLISPDSERTFATFLGAAAEIAPEDVDNELLEAYDYLYLEGYLLFNQPLMDDLLNRAKNAGMTICMDLASYNVVEATLDYLKEIIPGYIDIVFANEEEAKAYTGEEPEHALALLAQECDVAVVKMGKKGSLLKAGKLEFSIPAQIKDAVDTTGAGDLYAAGFLLGMDKGWQLDECGIAGALVAGEIVEVIGAKMDEQRWKGIKQSLGI
jgi:sugar/nucleoside kinase (ribokinase family)